MMKLSISNIAWPKEWDNDVYTEMIRQGYRGLEIAPTRIFPDMPYENKERVSVWYGEISRKFEIPSMQSIWFGKTENMFGSAEDRAELLRYTEKAVCFAEQIKCKNLVFGCPRNRVKPPNADETTAVSFFKEIGGYAYKHNTVIGIEANPALYNTNWLNTTKEALDFIETVHSQGVLLNLDIGAMIENKEDFSVLHNKGHLINHVHISEPGLKKIEHREMHKELREILRRCNYSGYVSIEMAKQGTRNDIYDTMGYVREVMGIR